MSDMTAVTLKSLAGRLEELERENAELRAQNAELRRVSNLGDVVLELLTEVLSRSDGTLRFSRAMRNQAVVRIDALSNGRMSERAITLDVLRSAYFPSDIWVASLQGIVQDLKDRR